MKLAANIGFLYREYALPARVAAAARDGFDGVECAFPYELPARELAAALTASGLPLVLINTPLGPQGEPGLAALAGREPAFRDGLRRALDYVHRCACPRLHVLAGRAEPGAAAPDLDVLVANLHWAADLAQEAGVTLLLEPLNRADMPGYAYHRPDEVVAVLARLARPQVRLQFDIYHARREGLDALEALHAAQSWIHHVQLAEAPDRSAPDPASRETAQTVRAAGQLPRASWLGLEYHPEGDTTAGLTWMPTLRQWSTGAPSLPSRP